LRREKGKLSKHSLSFEPSLLICRLVAEKGIISSFYGIALFDLTNENVFGLLLLLFSWPTLSFAVMLLFFG
jgi:hypothetical protein